MRLSRLYESNGLTQHKPNSSLDKDEWVGTGKSVPSKHYKSKSWQHGKPQRAPKNLNTPAKTRALGKDDNEYNSHILTSHK